MYASVRSGKIQRHKFLLVGLYRLYFNFIYSWLIDFSNKSSCWCIKTYLWVLLVRSSAAKWSGYPGRRSAAKWSGYPARARSSAAKWSGYPARSSVAEWIGYPTQISAAGWSGYPARSNAAEWSGCPARSRAKYIFTAEYKRWGGQNIFLVSFVYLESQTLGQWFSTCVPWHTFVPKLDAWCDLEYFASFDI